MTDEKDPLVERVAEQLRGSMAWSAGFDEALMAAVRREARPGSPAAWWLALRRPRAVMISPLGALALAAGLGGLIVAPVVLGPRGSEAGRDLAAAAGTSSVHPVQFVLAMPAARSVSLVGDFNDWDVRATPLARAAGEGVWSITVPLAPGRYRYTFVIDGTHWIADPVAPHAVEDDFGRPNSIVMVGEQGT